MINPKVLNKKYHLPPPDSIYIGRGSKWGNPFVIGVDGNRDRVCDKFEKEILPHLDIEPLRGKSLICFCAPQRCHGDSIMNALYGENVK